MHVAEIETVPEVFAVLSCTIERTASVVAVKVSEYVPLTVLLATGVTTNAPPVRCAMSPIKPAPIVAVNVIFSPAKNVSVPLANVGPLS